MRWGLWVTGVLLDELVYLLLREGGRSQLVDPLPEEGDAVHCSRTEVSTTDRACVTDETIPRRSEMDGAGFASGRQAGGSRTCRLLPLLARRRNLLDSLVPHAGPVKPPRVARELVQAVDGAVALLLDLLPRLVKGRRHLGLGLLSGASQWGWGASLFRVFLVVSVGALLLSGAKIGC